MVKLRNENGSKRLRRHTLAASSTLANSVRSSPRVTAAIKLNKSASGTPITKAVTETRSKSKSATGTPARLKNIRSSDTDKENTKDRRKSTKLEEKETLRSRRKQQQQPAAAAAPPPPTQECWAPLNRLLENLKGFEEGENAGGYRLQQVFRMHWRDDANDDADLTIPNIWKCEFAPPPPSIASSLSNQLSLGAYPNQYLVATVGCNSLCITDCQLNRVMFKYCHLAEANETFHSLAWSVVRPDYDNCDAADVYDNKDDKMIRMQDWVYLIAVAGSTGTIKIVNLNQAACYRCLKGHRRSIVDLKFLKSRPKMLLSASEDCAVRLWNIGSLSNIQEDWGCVAVYSVPDSPLYLAPSPNEKRLLVGTADADICDFDLTIGLAAATASTADIKPTELSAKRIKPQQIFDGDNEYWHKSPVDYLKWLNDRVVLSKGSRDEVMIWDYEKSTEQLPFANAIYCWPDFDASFFYGTTAINTATDDSSVQCISILGALKSMKVYQYPSLSQSSPLEQSLPAEAAEREGQKRQKSGGGRQSSQRNQIYSQPGEPLMSIQNDQFESGFRCVALSLDYRFLVAVDETDCVWIWSSSSTNDSAC